ncbi:MAG: CotH kinase family protein, partial [Saprospiraceae bacterium]
MKPYYSLFVILLLGSCSNFNEDLDNFPHATNLHLPPEQIETELPVINIIADDTEFQRMYDSPDEAIEINAEFNLYRNQELLISQETIELQLKGNYSRQFALRSLGIKFQGRFDNRERTLIDPPKTISNHRVNYIKAIRLRNSGNDFKQTMLKDLAYTQLAIDANLNVDLAYGEPALVYVNDEYLGLLNLRTEANTNGMASLYNVDKDDITLAKMFNPGILVFKDGNEERINKFTKAIAEKDVAHLLSNIDLTNFIDYMIFQSYIANVDWPYTNARLFAFGPGRFRFVIFDLDSANWVHIGRSVEEVIESDKSNIISDLFAILIEDGNVEDQFWNRYRELMDSGVFSTERFEEIVIQQKEKIER